jgi:hypothetical protein
MRNVRLGHRSQTLYRLHGRQNGRGATPMALRFIMPAGRLRSCLRARLAWEASCAIVAAAITAAIAMMIAPMIPITPPKKGSERSRPSLTQSPLPSPLAAKRVAPPVPWPLHAKWPLVDSAGALAHALGFSSGIQGRACRSVMSSMVCARASYVSATFGLLCSSPLMGNEEASPSSRVLARACTRHRGAQALAPRYGARLTLPVFPSFSAFSSIHL